MGIVMNAATVCQGCGLMTECNRGISGGPDGVDSGQLTCETCGETVILITFGVADREPTLSSIRRHNIERWPFRGLFYEPR